MTKSDYPTAGFKRTATAIIPHSIDEVFERFQPAARHLLYDWWKPTLVAGPTNGNLTGLIMRAIPDGEHADIPVVLLVMTHKPENHMIQYQVLWGDYELQHITITCAKTGAKTDEDTLVTWNECNTGIFDKGVALVTQFIEGGFVQKRLDTYAENITAELEQLAA